MATVNPSLSRKPQDRPSPVRIFPQNGGRDDERQTQPNQRGNAGPFATSSTDSGRVSAMHVSESFARRRGLSGDDDAVRELQSTAMRQPRSQGPFQSVGRVSNPTETEAPYPDHHEYEMTFNINNQSRTWANFDGQGVSRFQIPPHRLGRARVLSSITIEPGIFVGRGIRSPRRKLRPLNPARLASNKH